MKPDKRSAVVAGATGLVGRELVRLLLDDAVYERVVVLVRKRMSLKHAKLEQVVTDFGRLEEAAGGRLRDADVFCALGTTIKVAGTQDNFRLVDYTYPLELAKLAKREGAAQYVIVTAMGADPASRIFYSRVKGELETALRGLQLPSLSVLRPSLLLGEREEYRPGERIGMVLMQALAFAMAGPLAKYKAIPARAVALGMVKAAREAAPGYRIILSDEIAALAKNGVV